MPDWVSYIGFSVGWSVVRHMKEDRAYKIFDRGGERSWRKRGKGVIQYEKNLRRVVPSATPDELKELSNAGFRKYARYWCEAFRIPDWPQERILGLHVEDVEILEKSYQGGRAPVVVTPHAGNYDAAGAYFAARFGAFATVAERLRPEKLFQKFLEYRKALGMEILAQNDPYVFSTLEERVRSGNTVALVGDRDLSRHGVPVTFFGEPTRMPAGAALLARRSGHDLVPTMLWVADGVNCAKVFPPVAIDADGEEAPAVAAAIQGVADVFAGAIAEHPTDWHMLQPLWVADLDPRRDPMHGRVGEAPNA
ncbi:MAG: phosphatidylinositol mannoside acyltransferase [Candidatus Nanopelagicales bacterium]|nr:phosphatidylinositol mannoside acyltransferase [Candidatus Nanopelagicales bacterium]